MEVVVNGRSSKGAQGLPPYFGYKRRNCAVSENIHTPPTEGTGISWGWRVL